MPSSLTRQASLIVLLVMQGQGQVQAVHNDIRLSVKSHAAGC